MPKAPPKKQAGGHNDPLGATSGNASREKKPTKAAKATNNQPNPARTSTDPRDWNYLVVVAMLPTEPMGPPLMTLLTHPDLGMEEANDQDEADWTLADVYEKPEWKDKVRITYEYDMGDSWEHDICLLGRQQPSSWTQMGVPSDMKAICLAGSGHPVAEDCGGFGGWEDLKELFEKPKSKDEDGRKQWYKTMCSNGDKKGLNPHEWDMVQVNTDLSGIGL